MTATTTIASSPPAGLHHSTAQPGSTLSARSPESGVSTAVAVSSSSSLPSATPSDSHQPAISHSHASSVASARPTTPRAQPPYSRSHLRSYSGSSTLSAPPMARARSLPTAMNRPDLRPLSPSPLPLPRSASPLRSPNRTRSPRALDHRPLSSAAHDRLGPGIALEGTPSVCDISEDVELHLTPRSATTLSSLYSSTGSLARRRWPASLAAPPVSTTPSPLLVPYKFHEQYPPSLASSSLSSTPTSTRSRSPSLSSLETIEDSPDAEEKAVEEDRIARLKAVADHEDGDYLRRSSLDVSEGRGRSLGFGKRDARKRWSVCGAERRQDLDLETIWED